MSLGALVPAHAPEDQGPRWASALDEQIERLGARPRDAGADDARERVWLLAHTAIARYARFHASRLGWLSREDLEDLVSEKTLEFVQRVGSAAWARRRRTPAEIAGYLSRIARNGVVDTWRRRRVRWLEDDTTSAGSADLPRGAHPAVVEDPSLDLDRERAAAALARCVGCLDARAQRVWTLRALFDWPSREVAEHPDVGITPAHVDVVLQRARERIRRCMAARGFRPDGMPRGCIATIWARLSAVAGAGPPPEGDP
jgi:RNA polymerase sigma factor (sigma-70 family)